MEFDVVIKEGYFDEKKWAYVTSKDHSYAFGDAGEALEFAKAAEKARGTVEVVVTVFYEENDNAKALEIYQWKKENNHVAK